jgi:ligand-binding sensor domain-containing protein
MYHQADGLSGEIVEALAFDGTGRAWFGSYGGYVDSFDGHTWGAYVTEDEIADSSVTALTVDARGRVWLGDHEALTVFDGRSWTQYTSEDGYPGMPPWGMAADATGNIWTWGHRGVVKGSDDGTWTMFGSLEEAVQKNYDQILTTLGPTDMWFVEASDAIWVNGQRYDGGSWTNYQDLVGQHLASLTVGAVDAQGRMWFGSRSEGLTVFDGQTWLRYNSDNSPLADNWVREILVDDQGRVWIATFSGLYAVEGDEWQAFTSDGGLIDDNVLCLAFDHQGRLWVGTLAGISILDGSDWQSYPVMDVQDIVVDEHGNVWAGTLFDGVLIHVSGSQ